MSADEIIKFKQMLDDGIITQYEFNRKKANILGSEIPVSVEEEIKNSRIEGIKYTIAAIAALTAIGVMYYFSQGLATMRMPGE